MWQSLSNLLSGDGRALQYLLGVVVFLVLLGVVFGLYRLIFAHRLRPPGASRSRAPRLGLVDVFSLDSQRQLVIVRRDNVEHLLMIGGPNDLVIEPQIMRGAANSAGREAAKAAAPAEPAAEPSPPQIPRPVAPSPAATSPRRAPLRAGTPVVEPAAPAEAAPVAAENPPAPEPRVRPLPSRVEPPPVRPAPEARVEPPSPDPKPASEPPRKPISPPKFSAAPNGARPHLPSPITPMRPRNGGPEAPMQGPMKPAEAAPAAKAPEVVVTPPPAAPAAAPAVIVTPPPAPDKLARPRGEETFYDLESLEAEMARLLGRDNG
jgi:hypothetical protein